jgi:hypothetical protein
MQAKLAKAQPAAHAPQQTAKTQQQQAVKAPQPPQQAAKAQQQQQQAAAKAQQQQQQAEAAAEQKKQQEAAAKAAKLKQCLDVDQNCTYGTSNRCKPATAYGDHWAERREYERAQTQLQTCANEQSFTADCGQKVMAATPSPSAQKAIEARVSDLSDRASKLPSSYGCTVESKVFTYNGSSVHDYCSYARNYTSCMQLLVDDAEALEAARKLDECVYYGTFQYTRDQLRAEHDANCHKQFD